MTDQAKDKQEREAEEEAKRLWSVTITMLRNGQDLNSAMIAAIAAKLRERNAEREELTLSLNDYDRLCEKFPCGHRKLDWDDSYGECVFCKIKQQADDYDRLPHGVLECHDKIEELEAQLAAANSEVEHLKVWPKALAEVTGLGVYAMPDVVADWVADLTDRYIEKRDQLAKLKAK